MLRLRRQSRYGAVLRAARGAIQGYRAAKKIQSRKAAPKKSSGSSLVTSQKDVSVSRKRKRSKTTKKQVAFRNKVKKALAPDQAVNCYQETEVARTILTPTFTPVTQYQTVVLSPSLNINMGTSFSTTQNAGFILGRYRNIEGSTNPDATQGAKNLIAANSFKLNVHNSMLEVSLTNVTTNPIVMDIYECYAMKDINVASLATPATAWTSLLFTDNNAAPIDASTNGPIPQTNGQTPYDCPNFGKHWGIQKKTRVLLPAANTTEYKMYGGKYKMNGDKFNTLHAIKGISKGLLIIAGIGDNTGIAANAPIIRHVVNTTYHFKYEVGEDELPQRPTSLVRYLT